MPLVFRIERDIGCLYALLSFPLTTEGERGQYDSSFSLLLIVPMLPELEVTSKIEELSPVLFLIVSLL